MSAAGSRGTPVANAANGLTAVRLALVPVFLVLVVVSGLTAPGWRVVAAAVFLVASLTDFVDGWIARRYRLVTNFGKVADPIADKALIGTALMLLSGYGALPWWVTGLVLARELGVTGLRFWVIRHRGPDRGGSGGAAPGRGVIAASRGGKAKTGLQIAAITWYLLPLPAPLDAAGPWLMAAAVVVTVATGLDYAARALRLPRRPAGQAPR